MVRRALLMRGDHKFMPRSQPTRAELRQRVEELQGELEAVRAGREEEEEAAAEELQAELREACEGKDAAEVEADRLRLEAEGMRLEAARLTEKLARLEATECDAAASEAREEALLETRDEADRLQW